MAAQLSCSFASHSNSACNFSARFPGKHDFFFPLSSCTNDIKSHLRQLKVVQTSAVSEKDLNLARERLFNLEGNNMTVCPKHRVALGTWWRLTKLSNVTILYMVMKDNNRSEEKACR